MAVTTIKSTYALDVATVRRLDLMARRWGVSKSAALRRAIQQAADEAVGDGSEALRALDEAQRTARLKRADADRWSDVARTERRAIGRRHGRRA